MTSYIHDDVFVSAFGLCDASVLENYLLMGWWGPGALAVVRPKRVCCWISFALVFSFVYCWALAFVLSPFCALVYVFWGIMRG